MADFLLDTCVLSDGIKQEPDARLLAWLDRIPEARRFVSILSLAEITFGILTLPEGRRKKLLSQWYTETLRPSCEGRLLDFTEKEAVEWARIRASRPSSSFVDSQLAATALARDLTVVTRNVRDFRHDGIQVINPWQDA